MFQKEIMTSKGGKVESAPLESLGKPTAELHVS
jgi:hypothetical protein